MSADDKFIQEQINELQKGHTRLEGLVDSALDKADRNANTMRDMRNDIDGIKRNMITPEKMVVLLENERNQQIVSGLKWAAGIVLAGAIAKWVAAVHWFEKIGS